MLTQLGIVCRPIDRWPGEETKNRKPAPFRASWARTLEDLRTELHAIKGQHGVLQVALQEHDIRNDGCPKARARPSHPGVILAIETKHGPLKIACDRFDTMHDNIRAIALALHDLRRLDRYGITKRGEQYTAWKALPETTNGAMSIDEAVAVIAEITGLTKEHVRTYPQAAWRVAVQKTHPDRGGSVTEFEAVNRARAALGV